MKLPERPATCPLDYSLLKKIGKSVFEELACKDQPTSIFSQRGRSKQA
ncbi:MAG: hypothetical protein H7315_15975 [Herminiimonas sp.]|nr:hypothetical protein [Herminiimonas sp.]